MKSGKVNFAGSGSSGAIVVFTSVLSLMYCVMSAEVMRLAIKYYFTTNINHFLIFVRYDLLQGFSCIAYLYPVIMFLLFTGAVVVQLGYLAWFFRRVNKLAGATAGPGVTMQRVSVVICARNEAANLSEYLPLVLSQEYATAYEVVVVNDASDDNTAEVLAELEQANGHLKVITIPLDADRVLSGKKHALSIGVAGAAYDWLLLTDADCRVAGNGWLAKMVAPLAEGKEIVAGYGGYNPGPGLLNAFVRWETLHTFVQYSTYALTGIPYMAVGRNMACTKQVLNRAQQNEVWNKLPSGDDDLLVSVCGNKRNTAIVYTPEAQTKTDAKAKWDEWARQKRRHLSTGKYYKPVVKRLLGGYALSHAVMWFCFVAFIFTAGGATPEILLVAVALMALRCMVYWYCWAFVARRLSEKGRFYSLPFAFSFPLFDFGWMIYNFAFFPYIAFKNKMNWK